MTCPGSGRIPLGGGSLPVGGKLLYQIHCRECGQWFRPGQDDNLLPKHDRELQGRLL